MIKEIEIGASKIIYRVYGKGRPVVLIHGFGETGDVWDKQVEYLANDFLLIIPDLPGSGQSEIIEDMSMEGMAEAIRLIADHELPGVVAVKTDLKKIAMIGHSMGGYIALAFLEKYPSYLSAFGLFHSSAFADSEEKKETRQKGIAFAQKHGAYEFLKTSGPNLFSPFTKEERPELIDVFIRSLSNFSTESVVLYYKAMMQRPDRTHLLKATPLPVLFVLGKYDTAIPLEDGLKLVHMVGKAYIHILYRSGHMGMLEEDEKSKYILHKFLSETEPPRSAQ